MQSQFNDLLTIAERDGEGGLKAEPPSLVVGERIDFELLLPADEVFGDWTEGTFDAVLRAAPGASSDPLAEYVCTTGTPAGGLTPLLLALNEAGTSPLASLVNTTSGLGEVFFAVAFTPTGGSRKTRITTRQIVRGAI